MFRSLLGSVSRVFQNKIFITVGCNNHSPVAIVFKKYIYIQ